MIKLKTAQDIARLRESGAILSKTLTALMAEAGPGVVLKGLDALAASHLRQAGATSAFLGYLPEGASVPYRAHICTSVNEQVVHGPPTDYRLKEGDLLKIDFGVNYGGYITDAAVTIAIGNISSEARRLITATKKALDRAIKAFKPGVQLGDIGWAIQNVIKGAGFCVIKNLTGHGVGFELHEEPTINNYGERGTGSLIEPGTVLAIEPMASLSADYVVRCQEDESYVTSDGSVASPFEQTIAVTDDGCEVLTPYNFQ